MSWAVTLHRGFNVAARPTRTLLPIIFVVSFLSLSLTPSFISLICHLSAVLLYTQATTYHPHYILKAVLLWLTLTSSISLSHLTPSIHALSTPATSILSLILLSSLSSAIALVPVYLRHQTPFVAHAQTLIFPSLWATTWLLVSWVSPIGRLITWTPLSGIDSYRWILPFLGFSGLDWITAAWASMTAQALGSILLPEPVEADLYHDVRDVEERKPSRLSCPPMMGLLLTLAVPSFFINTLTLPPMSTTTTPLSVACILPKVSSKSQFDRFFEETRSHTSQAKLLLWPESAVTFETEPSKEEALNKIQVVANQFKVWIGVSFEERESGTGTTIRDGQRRNGLALVGPGGVEMAYYKRKLVPIAESFSQIASDRSPPVHIIIPPRPNSWSKKDWGPETKRGIPLTASICLDFSAPLTSLETRPALVLAPAKTWHVSVGRAMYELARARGEEIGAEVLWCDGGAGGISGVAGNTQVGEGTWVKVIGVPYPSAERQARTVYGVAGDWLALAAVLGLPVLYLTGQQRVGQIGEWTVVAWTKGAGERVGGVLGRVRRRKASAPVQQTERLIDDT